MTQPFSLSISPARRVAFQVLREVGDGGYASDLLRRHTRSLDGRDAGLASQIVFGSLRFQAQLDYLITHYSHRPLSALEPDLILALRTALFQLRYLERIPSHAAVHETVELVKSVRRKAAGFANAVLRKVRRTPVAWPDQATELSCPEWLLASWSRHFGADRAVSIARAALAEPVPYVRVPAGTEPPAGATLEPTSVPGCFRVETTDAALRLHDIGSQTVMPQLGLEPGHTYLDLCAAPGNKTRQALETPLRLAIACDISPARLETVPPVCPRVVLDGTQPLPFGTCFDRIFIDAPCSGTGTIGRNPEIKWRLSPQDLPGFAERQARLIASALEHLAPQGRLLYATCSLEREENEEVVARARAQHPRLQLLDERWRLPDGPEHGDGFYGALLSLG